MRIRLFLISCFAVAVCLLVLDRDALTWTYGELSTTIFSDHLTTSTSFAYNNGYSSKYVLGDTWYSTWADDDNVYVTHNDTFGWNCTSSSPCPSRNLLFSRLTSPVDGTTTGTVVNTMDAWGTQGQQGSDGATYKSSGLISVNGTLYWSIYRQPTSNPVTQCGGTFSFGSQIIKSTDHGATWTPTPPSTAQPYASPMFTQQNWQFHVFVQYTNKDYIGNTVDNSGTYVYAVSVPYGVPELTTPHILGRVKIANIGNLSASDWSWYTGGNGMLDASWSSNIADAVSITSNVYGTIESIQYFPLLHRYFALDNYPTASGCNGEASNDTVMVSYEAPHPWGPWTAVQTNEIYPQGFYFPAFVMKSVNGRTATALVSGDFNTFTDIPAAASSGNYYTIWLMQILLNDVPVVTPSGSCAQSTQFFARAGALDTTHHNAYDTMICGMVSDGTWPLLDVLYIFATQNSKAALTNLTKFGTATLTGSPAFQADRGFTGDDQRFPADYISIPYYFEQVGNAFTLNSGHISTWVVTNLSATNGGSILGIGFTNSIEITDTYKDGLFYATVNDGNSSLAGVGGITAPTTRAGHWIVNRTGASLDQIFQNGTSFATPNATVGALINSCGTQQSTGIFVVLARYICSALPPVQFGTPNQVAMASSGAGMTPTQVTNFYNRLRTYMTAVGVP